MSGCGADKHLVSTDCLRQGISKSMTKVGWFRDGPIPLRFQGGVARSAGVVRKRSRSLLICPRSDPYFLLENTNHPVCAAKERGLFIRGAATPPLKGGEWSRNQPFPLCPGSQPVGQLLINSQFSSVGFNSFTPS